MTWFETLTGFPEESPQQVRRNITVDGTVLKSHINEKVLICGDLETPSLAELRERVQASGYQAGNISVREVVADAQRLHTNESNAGSLFQVASQFNLLEMTSPSLTPEQLDSKTLFRYCEKGASPTTLVPGASAGEQSLAHYSSASLIECLKSEKLPNSELDCDFCKSRKAVRQIIDQFEK